MIGLADEYVQQTLLGRMIGVDPDDSNVSSAALFEDS